MLIERSYKIFIIGHNVNSGLFIPDPAESCIFIGHVYRQTQSAGSKPYNQET